MDNNVSKGLRLSPINISYLPDDIMYGIFRWLEVVKLLPFSRVCKRWRWLIDDPRLRKVLKFRYKAGLQMEGELPVTPILLNAPLLHTFETQHLNALINPTIKILAEKCPHLSVLKLSSCRDISEESWQLIGAAPWLRLTHLSLQSCRVKDQSLATILPTLSTLTILDIIGNPITNDGILCITGHTPILRCLLLAAVTDLTSASTVPLLDAVGLHLTQLSLRNPDRALLEALPTACVRLRVLALELEDSPINAVVGCLLKLTHLTHLHITHQGLEGARDDPHDEDLSLGKLEYLKLNICPGVSDYMLGCIIRRCGSSLKYFCIGSDEITDGELIDVLRRCTSIMYLELLQYRSQPISWTLVEALSNLPHLYVLVIDAVTSEIIEMLPNTVVFFILNFYTKAEYNCYRLPDILCHVLDTA